MKACAIHSIRLHSDELFVIRQHKRNGQPDEGVCDIQHTVHSDELFVIRQHKRNGQPYQGVCDIWHAVHSDELFALTQENIKRFNLTRCVCCVMGLHAVHSALVVSV